MRRLLILITACLLILLIVVVPAAIIGAAAFTESGLQFLVRHIPERFGSGPGAVHLKITGVSGTLAHGVHDVTVAYLGDGTYKGDTGTTSLTVN